MRKYAFSGRARKVTPYKTTVKYADGDVATVKNSWVYKWTSIKALRA